MVRAEQCIAIECGCSRTGIILKVSGGKSKMDCIVMGSRIHDAANEALSRGISFPNQETNSQCSPNSQFLHFLLFSLHFLSIFYIGMAQFQLLRQSTSVSSKLFIIPTFLQRVALLPCLISILHPSRLSMMRSFLPPLS